MTLSLQNAVFEENLRQYRRNVHDMEMSFKTIMRKIDADQMFDDVHANVWTASGSLLLDPSIVKAVYC